MATVPYNNIKIKRYLITISSKMMESNGKISFPNPSESNKIIFLSFDFVDVMNSTRKK